MFPRRAKFFIQFDDPALYTGHQVRFILVTEVIMHRPYITYR